MDQSSVTRIKELVEILNKAGRAYYSEGMSLMTDHEYDALYDELKRLEEETGVVLNASPTQHVGYEVVSSLPKERHPSPMLSLDKTKDREVLRDWLNGHEAVLSWKMDGLTIVLTYNQGRLLKAVTRGNGEVGEVVTPNARVFANVPQTIAFTGELILRGEAVITYEDFERINGEISGDDEKYKNPRNLCAGSVRQLNSEITAKRNVNFFAFSLVSAEGVDFHNSFMEELSWLSNQGFTVVEHHLVNPENILERVQYFADHVSTNPFPSDGLVITYEDVAYGRSLGRTAKFPRNAYAFKWQDELATTHLRKVEWSASRTGLINPVAIFDSVELEGTTVSRASVHNVSIVEELELGIGDEITVYKANMIIPQIAENRTRSGNLEIPSICPVCGGKTQIHESNGVKTLYCTNPSCQAKHVKAFTLFVSRDAMNIDGISEATMEKFIQKGWIHEPADIYHLSRYRNEIVTMEGFGEKSYQNMMERIEASRKVTFAKFLYALGIPNIGLSTAKLLAKEFQGSMEAIRRGSLSDFSSMDGIGEVIAQGIVDYFANTNNQKIIEDLLAEVEILPEETSMAGNSLEGLTFVITGSVEHFANRNELKDYIEARGGKTTGSVTSKTNYLINNDVTSNSSKNKKAKELGIPILSEEDFLQMTLTS
ncbi:MAG: NAD-dependent DNA ligase LigA [Lachnospiraceae bacterium]|nr:NAD-dependent DNA ligase LigA [Lachnospiraceae bacterium]